jgi:hypothetical protein
MSCFIVENKTINRIINFCFWEHDNILKSEIRRELKKIGVDLWGKWDDSETDKLLKEFGEELLKLNLMAYYSRYGHLEEVKKDIKETVEGYKFEEIELKDRQYLQVLKSLHCFLYQCSEGDIPETPLFKCIEKISQLLAENIINKLPDYEKAAWG